MSEGYAKYPDNEYNPANATGISSGISQEKNPLLSIGTSKVIGIGEKMC